MAVEVTYYMAHFLNNLTEERKPIVLLEVSMQLDYFYQILNHPEEFTLPGEKNHLRHRIEQLEYVRKQLSNLSLI